VTGEQPDLDRLAGLAAAGDRRALEEVLGVVYDRTYPLALRLLGDRADAEDATQEALLAVVRGLPRFDGRSAFATWTYRVATNACLDELRRRRRRPVTTELADDPSTAATPGPETAVDDREEIQAALAALPEAFRVAVVLRDLCDLEYAEIAEVLDLPAGTVRSRIARGRAQLADLLRGGSKTGNRTGASERRTEVP
jgi:RNA polymerase sigma-70 factor, ECF subfamily